MDYATARAKKTIEVYVDASSYYKGETLDVMENLRQVFLMTGLPEIRFISTAQSMREQANSASPSLLKSARAATGALYNYDSIKPDTHFSRHFETYSGAHDYYFTPACRAYQEALIDEVLPNTILNGIQLIENLKARAPERSLADICRNKAKEIKQETIYPDEPSETFSHSFRKKLKSVYTLAFAMQQQHAKNGYHDLHHTHWDTLQDVKIVNTVTKKIDDPIIIQALALHPYFWNPVNEYMKQHEVKRDSADKAILYYYLQDLQNKPDRDDRMLLVLTDDKKLRESFAAYESGTANGNNLVLNGYSKPHSVQRKADLTVETTLTLPETVHGLLSLVPKAYTHPIDGNPLVESRIEQIENSLKRIKTYGRDRTRHSPLFQELAVPYEELQLAQHSGNGRHLQR